MLLFSRYKGAISNNNSWNTIAIIRKDSDNHKGYIGYSEPPYTEWNWKGLDVIMAGQDFIIDNEVIMCVFRNFIWGGGYNTNAYFGTTEGIFDWCCILPSAGDTGYAGICDEGKE